MASIVGWLDASDNCSARTLFINADHRNTPSRIQPGARARVTRRPRCRIAIIATQGGNKAELDLRALMVKRLTISASTLRAQPVANKGRIAAALRENVWPLFETRGLKPVIHARFPLADAAGAHRLMESDTHVGKIVLLA